MATTTAVIDTAHADMVHDAQFDYYGRRLATASSDRVIKVFDVSGDETVQSAELGGCVLEAAGDASGGLRGARYTTAWRASSRRMGAWCSLSSPTL